MCECVCVCVFCSLLCDVCADMRVYQVLANGLSNAVKVTDSGSIEVRVSVPDYGRVQELVSKSAQGTRVRCMRVCVYVCVCDGCVCVCARGLQGDGWLV